MISNNLLYDRVAINIRWKFKHWAYEQQVGVQYLKNIEFLLAGKA